MIILFGVIGLVVGSFLNVCIDRLPKGRSLIFPPSHCESCGRRLAPLDLIPVLSYIMLRGQCRYCKARIPLRIPIVEAFTGAAYAFIWWSYDLTSQSAFALIFVTLFIVIFVIDWEHHLIPNKLIYPSLLAAPLLSTLWPGLGIWYSLLGGVLGFGLLLLPYLVFSGGMGAGDVKLAALVGLVVGFPLILLALLIGIVVAGAAAVALLASGRRSRQDAVAFGPFLVLGAIVTLYKGPDLAGIYWQLVQFS
jgi:leader peptidase (prepilin peptidase)/N-methyltransferase